jgi:site-specific recombinase XerD
MAELELQKRHSLKCRHRDDPYSRKCRCVIRVMGTTEAGRIRQSLRTSDWGRASRRLAELEESLREKPPGRPRKLLTEAAALFQEQHRDRAEETQRKYKRILKFLTEHCGSVGITYVDQVTLETLDGYTVARGKANWTWVKEVEVLRQFFKFCLKRKWCEENVAADMQRPTIREANDVVPYTRDEIVAMIAAAGSIGRRPYERLRARAMVLVLRHTGLRISDVVTLSHDDIQGSYVVRKCIKNHRWVRIELPAHVLRALDTLPLPEGAPKDCRYYFATGNAKLRSLVAGAERTLKAVFKRSGVERAHAHRFRHTIASEILGEGGTIEDAANVLGDDPAIVRRHYAKWIPAVQARQDLLLRRIHGTDLAQATEHAEPC